MATKSASKTAAPESVGEVTEIVIERIVRETVEIPIVGITPLIVHNWDPKARAMLPGGELSSKGGRKKAEHPTPEEAYESSRYRLPDGRDGFPATGFKASITDAYYLFDGVKKKQLKTNLFIEGHGAQQLVPIIGEPEVREDVVRIGMGTSNLRHRAMYAEWEAVLKVTYIPRMLSRESVFSLVDAGGLNGIGEWRPSAPKVSTGTFGQYRLKD